MTGHLEGLEGTAKARNTELLRVALTELLGATEQMLAPVSPDAPMGGWREAGNRLTKAMAGARTTLDATDPTTVTTRGLVTPMQAELAREEAIQAEVRGQPEPDPTA